MAARSTIVYDIEVAGFPWEEVDEITRGYLVNRQRSDADREAVRDRTALFPGLGKVIAIGMWLVEEDRGLLLLEGDTAPEAAWEKVTHSKIQRGSEEELLARFWELVGRQARAPVGASDTITASNISDSPGTWPGPPPSIRSMDRFLGAVAPGGAPSRLRAPAAVSAAGAPFVMAGVAATPS